MPIQIISDQKVYRYNRYLEEFLNQFPQDVIKCIKYGGVGGLHDGFLKSFTLGDNIGKNNFTEFRVESCNHKNLYILKYSETRKCLVKYPTKKTEYRGVNHIFGDWTYDEFRLLKHGWIKHQIHFSAGLEITLEFKKFSFDEK